jgi:hypothetical protein
LRLLVLSSQDVGISGINDTHGGDVEELSASGSKLNVGSRVMVDRDLGEHSVVLNLGLPQRRAVVSDEDKLGLVEAEGLEGGLVSKDSLSGAHNHLKARVGVLAVLSLLVKGEEGREVMGSS